jgi:hypothetical protein
MYKLKLLENSSCFSSFGNKYQGMINFEQFQEYFFPNINVIRITNKKEESDIYICGITSDFSNENYNHKVNILLCIENITNPQFTWYNHYNNFGEYGNKNINIYIYNHITKIIKKNEYLAIPCIYFRMNYFKLKYNYYFNHNLLNTSFNDKKFCLIINKSSLNPNIMKFVEKIKNIGIIDNISIYNNYIYNKSCYNSIELLQVFNKYKFIISFENSYNDGYITEKIFNVFFSKSIPIYSGSKIIDTFINKDSFVNIIDTMNLSKRSEDKELFSGTIVEENTMNLSKRSEDKELFSGTIVEENINSDNYINLIEELNNNENLYNKYINCSKINNSYNDENFLEEMNLYIKNLL